MIALLTILFILLSCLSLSKYFEDKESEASKLFIFLTSLTLILVSGLRAPGVDRDYLGYVDMINNSSRVFMEPTFELFSYISGSQFMNSTLLFFIIYAVLGVTLKMLAIKKLSSFWMSSVLIYFSYSFILQDMTQIRTGVAVGFVLLALSSMYDRKLIPFLFFITLATLFHYSAILMLLLWFFKPGKINKFFYFLLLILSYLLVVYVEDAIIFLFSYFPEAIQFRVLAYDNAFGGALNIFNTWQLIRCGLSMVFLIFADKLFACNKYSYLLIKFYIFGTSLYVLLSSNPAFAARFSDLLFVFDILSLPLLVYLFRYRFIGKIVVILIAASYLFMNLYYNKIIN